MNCSKARDSIFRSMDGELNSQEAGSLASHVSACAACARELRLVSLPRRIAQVLPVLEPPPYFYQKLRARLESEPQPVTLWQILLGLSRPIVPALATVTLVLLSVFAYYQVRGPDVDVYQAYEKIFMRNDRPVRMVIAEHDEITEESVLFAMTEDDAPRGGGSESGEARTR